MKRSQSRQEVYDKLTAFANKVFEEKTDSIPVVLRKISEGDPVSDDYLLKCVKNLKSTSSISDEQIIKIADSFTDLKKKKEFFKHLFSLASICDDLRCCACIESLVGPSDLNDFWDSVSGYFRQYALKKIQTDIPLEQKKVLITKCESHFKPNYHRTSDSSILVIALYLKYDDSGCHPHLEREKGRAYTVELPEHYEQAWTYLLENHNELGVDLNRAVADFAKVGNMGRVDDLLKAGADINAPNRAGETALSATMKEHTMYVTERLDAVTRSSGIDLALCQSFISMGASLDSVLAPQQATQRSDSPTKEPSVFGRLCQVVARQVKDGRFAKEADSEQWQKDYETFFRGIFKELLAEPKLLLLMDDSDLESLAAVCDTFPALKDLHLNSLKEAQGGAEQARQAEQITKAKKGYSQATRNWLLGSGGIAVGLTTVAALTFAFTPALSAAFSAAGGTISFVAMALLVTALAVAIPLLVRKCQRRKQSWSLSSSDQSHSALLGKQPDPSSQ